jgi:hypothetical protein
MSPTVPCPECESCPDTQASTPALAMAAVGGAVAVLIFGYLHRIIIEKKKRSEYNAIPH